AKLNLALHITGKRNDGYHELDSLVAFADYGDDIEARFTDSSEITLEISGSFARSLEGEEDNLVLRAAHSLQRDAGVHEGAAITLRKHLPIGAGLGGGSADAAATLRALNRLWRLDYDANRLESIASTLGADVPACIQSRSCRMQGIGEQLSSWDGGVSGLPLLLIHPGTPLWTADIFRATQPPYSGALPQEVLERKGAFPWEALHNDLQAPAIQQLPDIAAILSLLKTQQGCATAQMTGSGSACFAIFQAQEMCEKAAGQLAAAFPESWVKTARLR
ncbi:MAG: 4-(cytidine 5'-diphospho)-2-C-methyl-D-erythritol kinase, partial [Rickettsiales bacterium]